VTPTGIMGAARRVHLEQDRAAGHEGTLPPGST
jgi:hypothetical protein